MSGNFIGISKNPDGPDLPLGLGMRLAQTPGAMDGFLNLGAEEKSEIIGYIQSSKTGEEAKRRIEETIIRLGGGEVR